MQYRSEFTKLPSYREFTAPHKLGKWASVEFNSISEMHNFAKKYARTQNENMWLSASWAGLETQTIEDFDKTGIAQESLRLTKAAQTKLPAKLSRLAEPHMAVTGGYWDTPSVLANLPLAARKRARTKLAPIDLRIAYVMSAGISAASMAPACAKITKAIWNYIQAGGAVTLRIADLGTMQDSQIEGLAIITKVNCSDVAGLSLALSPVMSRLIGGPLQNAFSDRAGDMIGVCNACPLPGYLFIGGAMEAVHKAAETVIKQLQIV